jgi:hypothetical protein
LLQPSGLFADLENFEKEKYLDPDQDDQNGELLSQALKRQENSDSRTGQRKRLDDDSPA